MIKFRFSPKYVAIALIFGILMMFSLIVVIQYTEAAFLVLMGWILLPIIGIKIYRKLRTYLYRRR
jgi:hypothetical protein